MNIYNYDDLGVFRSVSTARANPLEPGKWLVPRNATVIEPPVTVVNESAVFSGGVWGKMADHRGRTVWIKDTAYPHTVDMLGDILEEYTLIDPVAFAFPKWSEGQWIEDADAVEAQQRRDNIDTARTASGLAVIAFADAELYINTELDTASLDATATAVNSAATVEDLKLATMASLVEMRNVVVKTRGVLLKMVPYLLD